MTNHYRLVILRLHRDHQPGTAVVCLEARYASVLWSGADRIDRRFGTPGTWRDVIAQLAHVAVGAVLEPSSAVTQLVAGDEARSVEMTCVDLLSIQVAPGCLALSLDEILHAAAGAHTEHGRTAAAPRARDGATGPVTVLCPVLGGITVL